MRVTREISDVMVLRAWVEIGQSSALRVRIIAGGGTSSTTVTTADDACDIVHAWLDELLSRGRESGSETPR